MSLNLGEDSSRCGPLCLCRTQSCNSGLVTYKATVCCIYFTRSHCRRGTRSMVDIFYEL